MNVQPNLFQKLLHRVLMLQLVSAILAKVLHRADALALRLTGGKHTLTRLVGLPMVELTTTGARSGLARTLPMLSLPVDEKLVLIASNFGQAHNPAWYHNLKAHPLCEVRRAGMTRTFLAREVSGSEYQTYWQLAVSYYAGYEKYKERAAPRHIPVMVLEPQT